MPCKIFQHSNHSVPRVSSNLSCLQEKILNFFVFHIFLNNKKKEDRMASLLRKFGKTNLKLHSRRSYLRLVIRNYVVSSGSGSVNVGGGGAGVHGSGSTTNPGEAFSKKPECIKMICDPNFERHDTQLPPPSRQMKKDQVSAYANCPDLPPKHKISCANMPRDPNPNKKPRKPYVPGTSCKRPKPSANADPCEALRKDLCLKTSMPNCPSPVMPPNCDRPFVREICDKIKAPFPAYSELFSPPTSNFRTECTCLEHKSICK